ncbi:MAG TPA: hypothetical protein VHL81_06250 [Gemmatimonadales bacterium]|nr:hypothetical protein [Gemmatimonadales bacterium]
MRAQGGEQPRTHAGHTVEPVEAAEWPVGLAIRHDPLGERQTYSGQTRELLRARPVRIDALIRREWS